MFIRTIDNEEQEETLKIYITKMKKIYVVGLILFSVTAILGILINCEFLSLENRISVAQQFIGFFIIYMILNYIGNNKQKYKINRNRISIKKDGKIEIIMMYICCIGTIITFIF